MRPHRKGPYRFILKRLWRFDKSIFLISSIHIPLGVIESFLSVYFTAQVVGIVIEQNVPALLATVAAFAFIKLLIAVVTHTTDKSLADKNYRFKMNMVAQYAKRVMTIDYTFIESPAGKDMAQRAKNTMFGFDYRDKPLVESFLSQFVVLFSRLSGLFVFGGMIAILNPLILVALVMTAGITYFFRKRMVKYDHADKKRSIPIDRKINYLVRQAKNLDAAKDIKTYHLASWLKSIFDEQLSKRVSLYRKRGALALLFNGIIAFVTFAFNGMTYFYLIWLFQHKGLDVTSFILYFGLITGFNGWLLGLVSSIESLHSTGLNAEDLQKFMEYKNDKKDNLPGQEPTIEFCNVSYRYSGSDRAILKNLRFKIERGQKIAIVGINGAGKTTLIKLICGLYLPTAGCVKISGCDTRELNKEALFDRISAVFQDIYILPTTIERNITLHDTTDQEKLRKVLALSGLDSKIESLADREQTVLLRSVRDEAIDLSGGEMQKLALARALYKGGDILILDEPTAALDPIAENVMYQKYQALSEGKTSVFISHRLSSTRFCDKIFFLENGIIAEEGTHDELMASGGMYAEMFKVQSRYYREQEENP